MQHPVLDLLTRRYNLFIFAFRRGRGKGIRRTVQRRKNIWISTKLVILDGFWWGKSCTLVFYCRRLKHCGLTIMNQCINAQERVVKPVSPQIFQTWFPRLFLVECWQLIYLYVYFNTFDVITICPRGIHIPIINACIVLVQCYRPLTQRKRNENGRLILRRRWPELYAWRR